MSQVSYYEGWKALKDQVEELRHPSNPVPDVEEIFDAQIRQRFGEMIARGVIGASKGRPWHRDEVPSNLRARNDACPLDTTYFETSDRRMDKTEEYRRNALDAIEYSERARTEADRASWLRIAAKWLARTSM